MRKTFRPLVLLDADDVLLSCNAYAVELANQEYNFEPKLSIHEIKKWGMTGERIDIILNYYKECKFFQTQPILEGAYDFLKQLCQLADVLIVTAVEPDFMEARCKRLIELFPFFPKENIIMCKRKDLIHADFALDDGAHNILESNATYPILFRKPWNHEITGSLAVNTYEEFIKLLNNIMLSQNATFDKMTSNEHKIYCLLGPTGSEKNRFSDYLVKEEGYVRPPSYTTREQRNGEDPYIYVSDEEFNAYIDKNQFYETTSYGGKRYGTIKESVSSALEKGNVVMPIDICGAVTMQVNYPGRTVLVYLKKPKKELVENILKSKMPNSEKTIRLLSIDSEKVNRDLCDIVLDSTGNFKNMKDILDLETTKLL